MWLHVPSRSSRSAPASADSILPSDSQFLALAQSATWRGKLMPPAFWRRKWRAACGWGWMRRLSGLTLPDSTAAHGVASWIASLVDTRASRSVSQGSVAASTIAAGSGPTSLDYFARYDPDSHSLKTCQGTLFMGSDTFSATFPKSGSMRSGLLSERTMSALHIDEKDSSSWPTPDAGVSTQANRSPSSGAAVRPNLGLLAKRWPTATATAAKGGSRKNPGNSRLSGTAEVLWPTAMATDAKASGAADYSTESGRDAGTTLTDATVRHAKWETPRAYSFAESHLPGQVGLDLQAKAWATPRASLNENRTTKPPPSHGRTHGETLAGQASIWATPKACDSDKPSAGNRRSDDLTQQTRAWPTPMSADGEKGPTTAGARGNPSLGMSVRLHSGHQALPGTGPASRGVLNPRFVSWLMGLPSGWSEPTPIDPISFEHWETAWCQQVGRWRCYFLRVELECSKRFSVSLKDGDDE